jgi:hypothetical protein
MRHFGGNILEVEGGTKKVTGKNTRQFKRDLVAMGEDLLGYTRIGPVLQVRNTVKQANKLQKSGTRVVNDVRRNIRTKVNRVKRKINKYIG